MFEHNLSRCGLWGTLGSGTKDPIKIGGLGNFWRLGKDDENSTVFS